MLCLDEGFESAMTVMALPAGLRRFCRTSNHIERLNRELKRRSSVIGIFPNEESLVRTMGAVLIEESLIIPHVQITSSGVQSTLSALESI